MAEDKYKTPPKMQKSYDDTKQPEFDKAVEDAVNTTERGTQERVDALSDAAKKKDIYSRLNNAIEDRSNQAYLGELGVGIVTVPDDSNVAA